ncbi:MAG: hypothetical protein WD669_10470 [Pirellulales bacterium]
MKSLGRICLCVAAFAIATNDSATVFSQETDRPSDMASDAKRAWLARISIIENGRFKFTERRTIVAGSMPSFKQTETPLPPEDVSLEMSVLISFQKKMLRYDVEGPRWIVQTEEFSKRRYISVFDGTDSKSFYSADESTDNSFHPTGFINKDEGNFDSENYHLDAVLLAMKPPTNLLDSATVEVSSTTLVDSNSESLQRKCILFRLPDAAGNMVELWTDPARDWIILRKAKFMNDDLVYQLDVRYREDPRCVWLPHEWEGVAFARVGDKMRVARKFGAKLQEAEINIPMTKQEFQFEFPIGTEVVDRKRNMSFMVTDDGSYREITKGEQLAGATYEQLRTGELKDSLTAGQTILARRIAMYFTIIVVVMLAIAVWWRKLHHRHLT